MISPRCPFCYSLLIPEVDALNALLYADRPDTPDVLCETCGARFPARLLREQRDAENARLEELSKDPNFCGTCAGTGIWYEGTPDEERCPNCNGTGLRG